ncbi:MAG: sn-glycerol-3-phosphate ABC transporter ATP-binding protein UgpC [Alphaproteobacteria bacterium]
MADVRLRNLRKSFGDVAIINGVDLDIADGEFCVFVGPSGCGKSTLLRMIAGLEDITSGTLEIGGRAMNDVEPAERGVAMVFQSYALYPHMTVEENISFGLKMTGHDKVDIAKRTKHAADLLQLGELLHRKPGQLSGGQRQRVAIGRAIVRNPQVFLFDEPLSNLDAALRVQMRIELSKLHQDLRSTMIYVTHDQIEAMTMADKIVVLNKGLIEQIGSPLELYHRPNNLFVAGFIGSPKMNFIPTKAEQLNGQLGVSLQDRLQLIWDTPHASIMSGDAVTLGIRPEHLLLDQPSDANWIGIVRLAEYLGSETMIYLVGDDGSELTVKAEGSRKVTIGDRLQIGIPQDACHLFGPGGRAVFHGARN